MPTFKPKTVRQCPTCPWRVGADPNKIPNYVPELARNLRGTISSGLESVTNARTMACHYSKPGKETACAGWVHNQLGAGNNIGVRLRVMNGSLPVPDVDGEQHESYEDTLLEDER